MNRNVVNGFALISIRVYTLGGPDQPFPPWRRHWFRVITRSVVPSCLPLGPFISMSLARSPHIILLWSSQRRTRYRQSWCLRLPVLREIMSVIQPLVSSTFSLVHHSPRHMLFQHAIELLRIACTYARNVFLSSVLSFPFKIKYGSSPLELIKVIKFESHTLINS